MVTSGVDCPVDRRAHVQKVHLRFPPEPVFSARRHVVTHQLQPGCLLIPLLTPLMPPLIPPLLTPLLSPLLTTCQPSCSPMLLQSHDWSDPCCFTLLLLIMVLWFAVICARSCLQVLWGRCRLQADTSICPILLGLPKSL